MSQPRCPTGKRRYATSAAARAAVGMIRKHGERHAKGKPGRAYVCPRCNGWHLTSEPPR